MRNRSNRKSSLAKAILLTCIALGLFALATSFVFRHSLGPHPLAESVFNGRQVKLIMDSFAMDHNDEYPTAATGALYGLPTPSTSNDYFKQLFITGNTNSEQTFWIKNAKVCSEDPPDDLTIDPSGTFSPAETLRSGDNAWLYVLHQRRDEGPSRPLLVISPSTASGLIFDPELWDHKTIVVRIDGSAKPERLNPQNRLLDGDNKELLTPASVVWDGTTPTIAYPAK